MSRKAIGPGASGGIGSTGPSRATAARCGSRNHGFSSGPAQATKAIRPPGRSAAPILAKAATGIGEEHDPEA